MYKFLRSVLTGEPLPHKRGRQTANQERRQVAAEVAAIPVRIGANIVAMGLGAGTGLIVFAIGAAFTFTLVSVILILLGV